MNRPDLFLSGNSSFADGIMDIARNSKRIAEFLERKPLEEPELEEQETKKAKIVKTRKVIYLVTNWIGECNGPSYGRFFTDFASSPEGQESIKKTDGYSLTGTQKAALMLTWLLNQPTAVLLSASHTGQCTVWTISIDEPEESN